MDVKNRKGRDRISRGILSSFSDLSLEHQKAFLIIRNELCEFLDEDLDVYVFGSYYWGFWDEQSDYDVRFTPIIINNKLSKLKDLSDILMEKHKLDIDFIIIRTNKGILIPK